MLHAEHSPVAHHEPAHAHHLVDAHEHSPLHLSELQQTQLVDELENLVNWLKVSGTVKRDIHKAADISSKVTAGLKTADGLAQKYLPGMMNMPQHAQDKKDGYLFIY